MGYHNLKQASAAIVYSAGLLGGYTAYPEDPHSESPSKNATSLANMVQYHLRQLDNQQSRQMVESSASLQGRVSSLIPGSASGQMQLSASDLSVSQYMLTLSQFVQYEFEKDYRHSNLPPGLLSQIGINQDKDMRHTDPESGWEYERLKAWAEDNVRKAFKDFISQKRIGVLDNPGLIGVRAGKSVMTPKTHIEAVSAVDEYLRESGRTAYLITFEEDMSPSVLGSIFGNSADLDIKYDIREFSAGHVVGSMRVTLQDVRLFGNRGVFIDHMQIKFETDGDVTFKLIKDHLFNGGTMNPLLYFEVKGREKGWSYKIGPAWEWNGEKSSSRLSIGLAGNAENHMVGILYQASAMTVPDLFRKNPENMKVTGRRDQAMKAIFDNARRVQQLNAKKASVLAASAQKSPWPRVARSQLRQ